MRETTYPFGQSGKVYVIAEVANAAQGIYESHFEIIRAASRARAHAIKFQFYKYDELAVPSYEKYETFKRTFYTERQRMAFMEAALGEGLDVWVDVFDRWGLQLARQCLDRIHAVKIPPAVILDQELVHAIVALGLPMAVGVGGYEDADIDFVLNQIGNTDQALILMHGFQGFPTAPEDTVLGRIADLRDKYHLPVGFADHIDAEDPLAMLLPEFAFFAGASVIEKHIILDRSTKGIDFYSALEPVEFAEMVTRLGRCETLYGRGIRTMGEKDYLKHATRITSAREIGTDQIIYHQDIKFRRTGQAKAMFCNQVSTHFPARARHPIEKDIGISQEDIQKTTCGIVVLCRLNSTRLPRKALVELNGVPALERCLLNCLASEIADTVVLATSTEQEDQELATFAGKQVRFFAGSPEDPARRMIDAAAQYNLDFLVRVTGDSPLVSYELIDLLLREHFKKAVDYSYLEGAPLGAKAEVITLDAIDRLLSLTDTDGYSEYLTLYFKNNPHIFSLNEVPVPEVYRRSTYRLNLDYPEDYRMLDQLFQGLGTQRHSVALQEVLAYLDLHPEVAAINASIQPKYTQGDLASELTRRTTLSNPEDTNNKKDV